MASFVKDSQHFVSLLSELVLKDMEVKVSFDITYLFTSMPVDETIKIIDTIC